MKDNVKKLFGIDFVINKIEIKGLPVYITANRTFFKLSYLDNEFVLVKISPDEKFGVVAYEKQLIKISSIVNMPVALEFDNISKTQRDSLINRNIPFISDSGQLYLPFLGVMLTDKFVHRNNELQISKMMPITQALFLYLLYKKNLKPIMKKEAADDLVVTRTSITRASEQLEALNLISQEKSGKEYYMILKGSGIQMYEKAKSFMINPIQKKIDVLNNNSYNDLPLSGEAALANCTMLNVPMISSRAVYKGDIDMNIISQVDIRWESESDIISLELWKYNPVLFAKNGIVDPISLALCYDENVDERIEDSIEEYLEEYKW